MSSLFKSIVAGSALAAASIAAIQPAQARDHTGTAVAAGIIGLGLGAAIASSDRHSRYYDGGSSAYYGSSYGYDGGYYDGGYGAGYGYGYPAYGGPSVSFSSYDRGGGYGRRDHWRDDRRWDRHDRSDYRDGGRWNHDGPRDQDHWRR